MPDRRDFQPAACHPVQDSGPPDNNPFVVMEVVATLLGAVPTLAADRDARA
jgi:hypothetical protein